MLVSQQLYGFEKYQNKKEIQIKNGETITILLNNKLDPISVEPKKKRLYSRTSYLLIHGTSGNMKENTGNITIARPNQQFEIDIEAGDIDNFHPLDNRRNMKEN